MEDIYLSGDELEDEFEVYDRLYRFAVKFLVEFTGISEACLEKLKGEALHIIVRMAFYEGRQYQSKVYLKQLSNNN